MARLDPPGAAPRHALVIADGDVPRRPVLDAAWPGWANRVDDVIAADGGYLRARRLGLRPNVLVGDLDSLDPASVRVAEADGVLLRRARADKDESDAELALLEAVARGATAITVLGVFGGPRLDHALANVWLLAHPALAGVDLVLLDGGARVRLLSAPGPDGGAVTAALPGPPGGVVTLLPFGGDAAGVATHGLGYPLANEDLRAGPARGLSNVRTLADATVTLAGGQLLVIEVAPAAGATGQVTGSPSAPFDEEAD